MRTSTLLAAATAGLALAGTASAQVQGQQYFGLGGGGGTVTHNQPCPDIPCNTGDTCSCVTGSGGFTAKGIGGFKSTQGSYTLEVSADNSTAFNNGGGGRCFGSTGMLVLTLGNSSLTLPFSGTGCRIGALGGGGAKNALGIAAPTYIASSTGRFKNPQGAGSFNGVYDPDGNTIRFDVVGYGVFNGK